MEGVIRFNLEQSNSVMKNGPNIFVHLFDTTLYHDKSVVDKIIYKLKQNITRKVSQKHVRLEKNNSSLILSKRVAEINSDLDDAICSNLTTPLRMKKVDNSCRY